MEKPTKWIGGTLILGNSHNGDCAMITVGQLTSPNPRRIYHVCGFTFAKIGSKIKWNPDPRISQALVGKQLGEITINRPLCSVSKVTW